MGPFRLFSGPQECGPTSSPSCPTYSPVNNWSTPLKWFIQMLYSRFQYNLTAPSLQLSNPTCPKHFPFIPSPFVDLPSTCRVSSFKGIEILQPTPRPEGLCFPHWKGLPQTASAVGGTGHHLARLLWRFCLEEASLPPSSPSPLGPGSGATCRAVSQRANWSLMDRVLPEW